jgi:cytochrome c biogenesis protein CcdA
MVAPGALSRARASGSRALLGAAFAVCAAPCVGVVLGAILALAADSRTVLRGCILLAAYSLGITVAFVAIGIAFSHAMTAFRWVRNHYDWIRFASGGVLVALGLLLFFNRDWWLRVLLNRALDAIGLGGQL